MTTLACLVSQFCSGLGPAQPQLVILLAKVLTVAGGMPDSRSEKLVLLPGNVWEEIASLPRSLLSAGFASMENKFYILGNYYR